MIVWKLNFCWLSVGIFFSLSSFKVNNAFGNMVSYSRWWLLNMYSIKHFLLELMYKTLNAWCQVLNIKIVVAGVTTLIFRTASVCDSHPILQNWYNSSDGGFMIEVWDMIQSNLKHHFLKSHSKWISLTTGMSHFTLEAMLWVYQQNLHQCHTNKIKY